MNYVWGLSNLPFQFCILRKVFHAVGLLFLKIVNTLMAMKPYLLCIYFAASVL